MANTILFSVRGIFFTITINTFVTNPIFCGHTDYPLQCVSYEERCNFHIEQPCCNKNYFCQLEKSAHGYLCLKPVKIGMYCGKDKDCEKIHNTKCSKNKCICRDHNILVNNTCVPLLGGLCRRNEFCATENSVCIDNKCQCNTNYLEKDARCLRKILGAPCIDNKFCEQVSFAKCSKYNICKCNKFFYQFNSTMCAPLLGGFCKRSDECISYNALCMNNMCRCPPNFFSVSSRQCLPAYYSVSCQINEDSTALVRNSECDPIKKCTCQTNYQPIGQFACAPKFDHHCELEEPCATVIAQCIDYRCQCLPNYKYQSAQCIPLILEGDCNLNEDCRQVKNAVCLNKKCECHGNYIELNGMCAPILGGYCTEKEECAVLNAICSDNECQCRSDYIRKSSIRCLPLYLRQPCKADNECEEIKYAVCWEKKCTCREMYNNFGDNRCLATIDQHCDSDNECITQNLVCEDNVCQCRENFIFKPENYCEPLGLGKPCTNDPGCSIIKNSVCSFEKICRCKIGYYALNDYSCDSKIGNYCQSNNDCFEPHSQFFNNTYYCYDNKCQCMPGSSLISDSQCIETSLLHSCNNDFDCGNSMNVICYRNKCVCKSNTIALNKLTCFPLIGGQCAQDYQCMAENSACIDSLCQCKLNTSLVAINKCV